MCGGEWPASRPGRVIHGDVASGYQLNRKLGGFQSRSGDFREQKVSGLLPRIEHWIVQTVAYFPYRQPHTGCSLIIFNNISV